jgi:MFS family permease
MDHLGAVIGPAAATLFLWWYPGEYRRLFALTIVPGAIAVYVGFAVSASLPVLLGWFLVYGLYFGFAEGPEKALVADLAPASSRGFAFGVYTAVQGLGALAASVLFGMESVRRSRRVRRGRRARARGHGAAVCGHSGGRARISVSRA